MDVRRELQQIDGICNQIQQKHLKGRSHVCERAMFMGLGGVEREHALCIHVTQALVDTVMNPSIIKMRKHS
jgi:hypothetical protein